MDSNDARTDAPITEEQDLSEFDPLSLPLGTFAAFDVSDQPMWTDREGETQLTQDQKNAIRAMTDAAAKADSVPHRIEIQNAWWLQLLDRGIQRIRPTSGGGWEPFYGRQTSSLGIYGAQQAGSYYDTNVIGEKNDIIVALLTREIAEATFFPGKPGNPDDEVYAAAANCLKHFIAEENKYGKLQAEVGRFFCTDETAVSYTRPVADAQRWGYEETAPDVVPETEDGLDPDAAGKQSQRPKIRTISSIYGKLSRKVPIMARSKADWQYCFLSDEIDIAYAKAESPWIAGEITAGDLGIAEMKLDRLARQSINLAMQSQYATGDSLMRDVTRTRLWLRPSFYMDDSCPKALRPWFWENFPKGIFIRYSGGSLAFCRNESMDEVLTEFHAHTGNGQNRRALTESYAGPQMRLNVLVDLRDEFCRKAIPRVGLDTQYWNVDALRASSVRVGVFEPALTSPTGQNSLQSSIVQFPVATGSPDITAFIEWLAGPLADQLTHATQQLAGSLDSKDPEQTATESKLKDENAMSSFGEAWKDILDGFANITTQAVSWNARVQPEDAKFDSNFEGKGRVTAEIAKLKSGSGVARADGSANFPQSWADRQRAWAQIMSDPDPMMAPIKSDPRNLAAMKQFAPKEMYIPGVDSVEKQRAEFDILLKSKPQDNPQYLKIKQLIDQGNAEIQAQMQMGIQPDPEKLQALEQGQQMLQTLPPIISSVPVLPTDEDDVESLVCLGMIRSAEGRRLASSKNPDDQAFFLNLNLHQQQHEQNAAKKAQANIKPVPPKVSISVDPSKLPPQAEASALAIAGIPADPSERQSQDQLAPHEVTTTERGVGPTGSEIERKVSVVGKSLS